MTPIGISSLSRLPRSRSSARDSVAAWGALPWSVRRASRSARSRSSPLRRDDTDRDLLAEPLTPLAQLGQGQRRRVGRLAVVGQAAVEVGAFPLQPAALR